MGVDKNPHSEYEGGGVMPNTVFPKGSDAITASDALRLMSLTGQETDSQAQIDPYFWSGTSILDAKPTFEAQRADAQRRAKLLQDIAKKEQLRYRPTRRPNGYNY